MILDLREIIGVPGASAPFDCAPDLTDAVFGSLRQALPGARLVGAVRNAAGALTFEAALEATFLCECARCLREFEWAPRRDITVHLTADEEAGDDPEMFYMAGDRLDVDEVVVTSLITDAEQRLLCREDCRGLCEKCGSDLNAGGCACKPETDPRLAAFGRFLEEN
jgi:uncharacterized protein